MKFWQKGLIGLGIALSTLFFVPKAKAGVISGNIYGTYNGIASENTTANFTVNDGSSGTQVRTIDNTGYYDGINTGTWIPPPSFGDTIKASFTKTTGGKTYVAHTRSIFGSQGGSDLILPTVFLDDTSKAVKAHAIGVWKVNDQSTGFNDSLKARGWLKKNQTKKVDFINYYRQSQGMDSLSIDRTDIYPQVYINLEKQDSTWTPSDSAFVELFKIRHDSTFSVVKGFPLDTMKYGRATMLDSIIFNPTSGTPNGVELSYFGAMARDNGIMLDWDTQSSLDSYLWKIYRGKNNDSLTYDLIGTKPGDGNSNQPKHWYYDDKCARGLNWYKLGELDFSGAETFYGPVNATANVAGALKIDKFRAYPNPTPNLKNINVDKAGKYGAYNISGQRVGTIEYTTTGTRRSEFSKPVATGVYYLRQEETGEIEKVTVIK